MARPIKEGLEYFPLDCDMDQDDKISLIEAQHGLIGFGVVIKLLMKIYKNSYFYEWTEKQQLLFSKKVNIDINQVNVIINDLIKWKFFNKELYDKFNILTSSGIQKRYLAAVGRRQKVKILKEYLLLDKELINVYKNLVIVDMNGKSEIVNVDIGTQSKVNINKSKDKVNINNNNNSTLYKVYEELGFGTINQITMTDIDVLIEEYTSVWVLDAFREANKQGIRNLKYVEGILSNWRSKGKSDKKEPDILDMF